MRPLLIAMKSRTLLAAALLVGATAAANASTFTMTLEQVGSNVVETGSGSFDLTGLTLPAGSPTPPQQSYIQPNVGVLFIDSFAEGQTYQSVTGPATFGVGGLGYVSSSGGNVVGINGGAGYIYVPFGYHSGTPLSNTATWNGATFASLGLTPGTYNWTWDGGADSFTLQIGQTPLPAALPLFATGLGGLGLLGWRRKRAQAVA
jgi:hypothetical protein